MATNNVQAAAVWDQVIDTLDTVKKSTISLLSEVRNSLSALQSEQQMIAAQMSAADIAGDAVLFASLKQQNADLAAKIANSNIIIADLQANIDETDRGINDAFNQKFKADSEPPTTLSTTLPVSTPDANGVIVTPVPESAAQEPNQVDPLSEPLLTPDGAIEGEGDAGTGLSEPPVGDDGAAEGGNAVGNIQPESRTAASAEGLPNNTTVKRLPKLSAPKDWRVRISLAAGADYLYGAENAGILSPLKNTGGVIFPYTPTIQLSYVAKYDNQMPAHSNFNIHTYQGSSVEGLTITGDFTAQSVTEANYLLAVIHFFKSATKMFYGKDAQRGTPPPLLYLSGYGQYQFDNHPMVLTGFTYSLPQDVDYVDAYSTDDDSTTGMAINGVSLSDFVQPNRNTRPAQNMLSSLSRLISGKTKIEPGGKITPNSFKKSPDSVKSITRVPSKISISLTLNPMVTRRAISENFSLKDYATGKLLRGSANKGTGGGIW